MTGATLDTGALIALEAGSTRMAVLVEEALAGRTELAVPAGVLAQAWRGGGRQARIARLLRASNTSVVPLDTKTALRVGARCAATKTADIVDVSVVICASDRGHPVINGNDIHLALSRPRPRSLTSAPSRRDFAHSRHGQFGYITPETRPGVREVEISRLMWPVVPALPRAGVPVAGITLSP
jgi:hypothetical protein